MNTVATPSSSATSKRLPSTLSITTIGPRPLHLPTITGNTTHDGLSLNTPHTAPLASTSAFPTPIPSTPASFAATRRKSPSRRQSSISYLPPDSARHWRVRSPTMAATPVSDKPLLGRSVSLSARGNVAAARAKEKENRRASGSADVRSFERAALTLAEKHADLLHFIAQKESRCLELRSQLTSHEAELLQLKQKWERIVHRDFGKALGTHPTPSPQLAAAASPNPAATLLSSSAPPGNSAVLDGIVEGMQGVGRLLAAGLSTAGPAPTTSSSVSQIRTPSLAARPSPFAKRTKGHAAHQSTSSSSTYTTTTSTRLSQSSTSSLGEDATSSLRSLKEPSDDGVQELIVQDTGATPTVSPNPEFARRHSPQSAATISSVSQMEDASKSRIYRRRSREAPLVSLDDDDDDALSGRRPEIQDSESVKQTQARKRASVNGSMLPPASSMPGMGSYTWVGTVGKKIEELQKGQTFSKGQKRASWLLSDVSQSIFAALSSSSSPPVAIVSPGNAGSPASVHGTTARQSPLTSTSLLDDEDEDVSSSLNKGLGLVLTPDSSASRTPSPLKPHELNKTTTTTMQLPETQEKAVVDDDEEWNW